MPREEQQQAVKMAMDQIEKQFGKGTIMRWGERQPTEGVRVIPTGSIALDLALGIGGIPKGRIIEIFGPESSGKTTLALHILAEIQKSGGTAAFVDAEHALDPVYAQAIGVDLNDLLVSQPDTGEQALEITETLVRSGGVDLIVIDSVAALVPRAEIEGDMGDSHMGLQARLMSQALRKLAGAISKSDCTVIFINQLRMKIGVMFGNPETTTGGQALKFYSSIRLDIRRIGSIKQGDQEVGNRVKVKVVKNKMAPPFKIAEFDVLFGEGISREGSLIDVAVELDVINKSGSWFSMGDQKLGQGREAVRDLLKEDKELAKRVQQMIYQKMRGQGAPLVLGKEDEDELKEELSPAREENENDQE